MALKEKVKKKKYKNVKVTPLCYHREENITTYKLGETIRSEVHAISIAFTSTAEDVANLETLFDISTNGIIDGSPLMNGCYLIKDTKQQGWGIDERGTFFEDYNREELVAINDILTSFPTILKNDFSDLIIEWSNQSNISISKKGVVRGMHMTGQSKLVRCLQGRLIDIFIDMREDSETFGYGSYVLLDDISESLFIPDGYAHGFIALEDNTIMSYKCSSIWKPENSFEFNALTCFKFGTFFEDIKEKYCIGRALIMSDKDRNSQSIQHYIKTNERYKDLLKPSDPEEYDENEFEDEEENEDLIGELVDVVYDKLIEEDLMKDAIKSSLRETLIKSDRLDDFVEKIIAERNKEDE
jgi:dTDP-4-dehydrorhamnose 3,5-epimerase